MTDPKDLPELTHKQRKFVEGILEGKTASDAYRAAYNTAGWGNESVWVRASELKANSKVQVWLETARHAEANKVNVTLDWVARQAIEGLEACKKEGSWNAYFKGLNDLARTLGLAVDKTQIEVTSTETHADALSAFLKGKEQGKETQH